MKESTRKRLLFLAGKGKKGIAIRICSLISLMLVIGLTTLLIAGHSRQLTGPGASSPGGTDGISGQYFSGSPGANKRTAVVGTRSATGTTGTTPQTTMPLPASLADVTVDFGNRQNTAYPIPYRFLGIGGINIGTALPSNGNAVLQANFHLAKIGDYDTMAKIFLTAASLTDPSQQDWSKFDNQMTLAAQYNLQPIISLASSPTWLEPQNQSPPQTNPCLINNPPFDDHSVKPMYLVNGQDQGPQVWGELAAQVVAHVDRNFPQSHAMYEIWNQPDGAQFLCEAPSDQNADQDRVTAYRAIFAAAAPLMKQQGARDGVQVKIGGPALVYALQNHITLWFPTLLNDPAIYPYIDFITYHRYLSGQGFNAGANSLVYNMQDSALGVAAQYEEVVRDVRAGKQPNAATTPVYVDEYTMNPCYPNVCRNDLTYAPLMNSLFLVDLLNAAGSTGAVPAGLAYYTWNIPQQNLCMFGAYDAQMDCGPQGAAVQPYPEYYTYELFGSANYLDLTDGGFVANTTLIKPAGVYVSGFMTASGDSIAIANTTSQAYTTLHVFVANPGNLSGKQANVYTLRFNSSSPGNSIITSQVNLVPVSGGTGYIATINVPAYTTVGLSVK